MNESSLEQLEVCRKRIDEIDVELMALLNARTSVVETIGKIKQQMRLAIYEPKREEQVFANVVQHNRGPLPDDAVKRIFERIIDEMRTLQRMRAGC